ncbi:hypothetical protein M885DRAFT_618383 [Pelagophyceae sp. CCMP2097]|nr:hypothetical protein M885DRAFT_618383 [Pelagophyceae sp. CCMP2097]
MFELSASSSTWRLTAESLAEVRAAASAIGSARAAAARAGEACALPPPPRCLLDEVPPHAAAESGALQAADEVQLLRWYQVQMQKLVGRGAAQKRLRRSHKVAATAIVLYKRFYLSHSVLECEPMEFALCCIFVAGKLEDEFLSATDIAAAASDGSDAASQLEAAIFRAEPLLLAGVRFDLRVAHAHRPLAALVDAAAREFKMDAKTQLPPLVDAAHEHLDALMLTDAALLEAPTPIAVCALRLAIRDLALRGTAPLRPTPVELDAHVSALVGAATLAAAEALEAACPRPSAEAEAADAADLKKVRKRVKKLALWSAKAPQANSPTKPTTPPPSDGTTPPPSSDGDGPDGPAAKKAKVED